MSGDTRLNAARRQRELAALLDGRELDLLVIGLGITGTGIALDAASRGLRVAAIDAHDLAFGTSRWSSKLAHGGLRYLARGQVGIARESALERHILMTRTAPHLVRPGAWLMPSYETAGRGDAALTYVGLRAGDVLRRSARTPSELLPPPRRLNASQVLSIAPGVRRVGLRGGSVGWDGQLEDDARLVVAVARTAARHGASVLTRVRALQIGEREARIRDELTGAECDLHARCIINATGVWAGQLSPNVRLRPSRGSHLVVSTDAVGCPDAVVNAAIPGTFARYVFAVPQPDGRTFIGLTDEPVQGQLPDEPTATQTEIDFLLNTVNTVLQAPLTRSDVLGTFAGLRPLLDTGDGATADLSRNHSVITEGAQVTVVGGKLTTYRRMAQDAVDAAVRVADLAAGPCVTARTPLVGAAPPSILAQIDAPKRLTRRYGIEAPALRADPELWGSVAAGLPTTHAEFAYGMSHEGALSAADLLDRRTRIGLVDADRALAAQAAQDAVEAVRSS